MFHEREPKRKAQADLKARAVVICDFAARRSFKRLELRPEGLLIAISLNSRKCLAGRRR